MDGGAGEEEGGGGRGGGIKGLEAIRMRVMLDGEMGCTGPRRLGMDELEFILAIVRFRFGKLSVGLGAEMLTFALLLLMLLLL